MNEGKTHTIVFWVKASASSRAYHKMLEAIEDMGDDIEMTAVAPWRCQLSGDKLQSSAPTAKVNEK